MRQSLADAGIDGKKIYIKPTNRLTADKSRIKTQEPGRIDIES